VELLERLRAGDEAAFARLVDELSPGLMRMAGIHVSTDAAAEEVVQETWLGGAGARPRRDGGDGLTKPADITCKEVVEAITDYLEGTLPAADRGRFEAHLEVCPYCVAYLDQMRLTIEALGGLRADSIAPEQREALISAFRGWRERPA